MLAALTSDEYLNKDENLLGVLEKGQVGGGVGKAKYALTSWGDYYLIKAFDVELNHGETWW